ncbi:hypothetical protein [Treponema endosymbiont of Eucomonympha sp.]|uniref:hypothetical protein n=1 Tax=Treponema endosymbiont of Eucomonympha sp. TaxID=1580831 RepID=UPI000750E06B|nr:hypothetical protein [Treponema endosymbiont of Eucomonympha sp.]
MARGDWIPAREQDLVDLAGKWAAALADSAKQTAFGWDDEECAAVEGKIADFLRAWDIYEADNSTVNRAGKDEAKGDAVDAMRDFANSAVRFNKRMRDDDKLFLGIHPADTPTSHGAPTSQPETDVLNSVNHFEHKVRTLNRVSGDTSKPADAYGVRYSWQIGGERPATGAALPKTKFSRKTTLVIAHTEADKAQTAYYATCYENGKGEQ